MYARFAWRLLRASRLPVPRWGAERTSCREGFVYLRDVAPSIVQDMRYATENNFTGKPVPGYDAAECVLQRSAAEALKRAQEKAESLRFSLKVYDCYRPVRAVRAFVAWAAGPEDGRTKRYYPRLDKSQLVPGYIAPQSQHSTGLAVDLTLITASGAPEETRDVQDCTAPAPAAKVAPAPAWARPSIASTPRPTPPRPRSRPRSAETASFC